MFFLSLKCIEVIGEPLTQGKFPVVLLNLRQLQENRIVFKMLICLLLSKLPKAKKLLSGAPHDDHWIKLVC